MPNQSRKDRETVALDHHPCAAGCDRLDERAPIAMFLWNGHAACIGDPRESVVLHFHATLKGIANGELWWRCAHTHATSREAEECARSRWFAHHG